MICFTLKVTVYYEQNEGKASQFEQTILDGKEIKNENNYNDETHVEDLC